MTEEFLPTSINNPRRVRTLTTTSSINLDDDLIVADTNGLGAPITLTLPDARIVPGWEVVVKVPVTASTGDQNVVVQGFSGQLIDGAASVTVTEPQQTLILQSDGTGWQNLAITSDVAPFLDWKDSVRVATTGPGTLATSFENGDTIDGVMLATGDRILIKDQGAGAENGIYIVQASGAPIRADDANTSAKVRSGMATIVEEGTANADELWFLATNNPIVLDATALVFSQYNPSDQTLAAVLTNGNVTGGQDMIISDGQEMSPAVDGVGAGTSELGTLAARFNDAYTTNVYAAGGTSANACIGGTRMVVGDPISSTTTSIVIYTSTSGQAKISYSDASNTDVGGFTYDHNAVTPGWILRAGQSDLLILNQDGIYPDSDLGLDLGVDTTNLWATLWTERLQCVGGQMHSEIQSTATPGGTSQTVDFALGNSITVDFESATGNVTFTLNNPEPGGVYFIKIIQGPTPRNAVWPPNVLWPGGTAPTITVTDNAIDLIRLFYNGSNFFGTFIQDLQ